MKKVLLISPLPPPVGGVANWTKILLKNYKSKEIQLELINSSIKFRKITNHSKIYRIISGGLNLILLFIQLLVKFIFNRPNLIHICSSGSLAFYKDIFILIFSKIFFVKSIIHIHMGRIPLILKCQNTESYLFNIIIRLSDKTIVLDKNSLNSLLDKHKELANKFILLPNFIDFDEINSTNVEVAEDRLNIIYVGHIIPTKGITELFYALKELNSSEINLKLVGPVSNDYKNYLKTIHNINIQFLGVLDKTNVYKEIQKSSFLILPSYSEGFPNVVLEAMACKKPVLATSVGAIPEVLNINSNTKCGVCFEPKSHSEIVNAIQFAQDSKYILNVYGQNGKERIENIYSTNAIIPKLINIWKNL